MDFSSFETAQFKAPQRADGLSRRALLKHAAGVAIAAAGASLTGAFDVQGPVEGSMAGGGAVPLRLPLGAMDHLDRNQYIHNMEIHAQVSGVTAVGGEPPPRCGPRALSACSPAAEDLWASAIPASRPR